MSVTAKLLKFEEKRRFDATFYLIKTLQISVSLFSLTIFPPKNRPDSKTIFNKNIRFVENAFNAKENQRKPLDA